MSPYELEIAKLVVSGLTPLAVFFLGVWVNWRLKKIEEKRQEQQIDATRRMGELQYTRSITNAWMTLDTFLLSHPELLDDKNYERIVNPPATDGSPRDARKRLLIFLVLNPLQSVYHGIKKGYIEKETLGKLKPVLASLLMDDDVYNQTQEEWFEGEFAAFCKEVREGSGKTSAVEGGREKEDLSRRPLG